MKSAAIFNSPISHRAPGTFKQVWRPLLSMKRSSVRLHTVADLGCCEGGANSNSMILKHGGKGRGSGGNSLGIAKF